MPIGGMIIRNQFGNGYNPGVGPTSLFGNPATFTAAANKQASDYDTIMKNYADYIDTVRNNPISSMNVTPQILTPQTTPYSQSSDVTGSLSKLSDLATTGGYSGSDIADIRARDISPIRSIYANAQQNVERQRALSGGYSPNFNAVQGEMARDESNQIADKTTAVNAGIAQSVAANKIAAAPSYASAAASADQTRLRADQANTDIINQINAANAANALTASTGNANRFVETQFQNRGGVLGGIQGMQSLYGTTPALTNTFGNQVMQAGQLGQGQQGLDEQKNRDLYSFAQGVA